MAGGLLQLAAYGSENQYIHGNPQITFFKMVYKRHTIVYFMCSFCLKFAGFSLDSKMSPACFLVQPESP